MPVLVMDYDNYKNNISDFEKPKIINRMRQLGGFVSLVPNLQKDANKKAIEAAKQLTLAMQSRRKEIDKDDQQEADSSLVKKEPYFTEKLKPEEDSLFSKVWQGTKTNFKKLSEKFNLSNNKPQETTSVTPKKRLASEVYQEMIDSLKDTTSYPEKAGIDIFNNSEHLDLMLAMQLTKKDAAYEIVLKQSPNYRSKEPDEAKAWLEKMLADGISLSKEYYFDSDGSQEIIRSYDNDASRPPEKSNFEKFSESVQRYNSSYSTDREGLLVAVATAAIKAGMNPEQVLRQDPKYSANEKGEALVEKTIEKAESNIQAEKSRVEQQALRDSQRGLDRGYER